MKDVITFTFLKELEITENDVDISFNPLVFVGSEL